MVFFRTYFCSRSTMRFLLTSYFSLVTLASFSPVVASGDLTETARAALIAFTEAVRTGPEALAPMLAPEYQIMRANGVGYDRDSYLGRGAGTVSIKPDYAHEEIIATTYDDVLVVRYFLRIEETIDGNPVEKRAPRLTVFRKIEGQWKVVAHANFGARQ